MRLCDKILSSFTEGEAIKKKLKTLHISPLVFYFLLFLADPKWTCCVCLVVSPTCFGGSWHGAEVLRFCKGPTGQHHRPRHRFYVHNDLVRNKTSATSNKLRVHTKDQIVSQLHCMERFIIDKVYKVFPNSTYKAIYRFIMKWYQTKMLSRQVQPAELLLRQVHAPHIQCSCRSGPGPRLHVHQQLLCPEFLCKHSHLW